MFETNKHLGACGPYVSCEKTPHIQTFMIAFNKNGLNILENTWRCIRDNETRGEWVERTEVHS